LQLRLAAAPLAAAAPTNVLLLVRQVLNRMLCALQLCLQLWPHNLVLTLGHSNSIAADMFAAIALTRRRNLKAVFMRAGSSQLNAPVLSPADALIAPTFSPENSGVSEGAAAGAPADDGAEADSDAAAAAAAAAAGPADSGCPQVIKQYLAVAGVPAYDLQVFSTISKSTAALSMNAGYGVFAARAVMLGMLRAFIVGYQSSHGISSASEKLAKLAGQQQRAEAKRLPSGIMQIVDWLVELRCPATVTELQALVLTWQVCKQQLDDSKLAGEIGLRIHKLVRQLPEGERGISYVLPAELRHWLTTKA
jgi:hypothetical protein